MGHLATFRGVLKIVTKMYHINILVDQIGNKNVVNYYSQSSQIVKI